MNKSLGGDWLLSLLEPVLDFLRQLFLKIGGHPQQVLKAGERLLLKTAAGRSKRSGAEEFNEIFRFSILSLSVSTNYTLYPSPFYALFLLL